MDQLSNEQILAILKKIESSDGQNLDHPPIAYGLDKGTRAIGNYGLTNSSINDIVKRDPKYQYLQNQNALMKKTYLEQSPKTEQHLVNSLLNRLQERYQGDPAKIAYSWNHGTYIKPEAMTDDKLANDQYTQKFELLRQKLGMIPSQARNLASETED